MLDSHEFCNVQCAHDPKATDTPESIDCFVYLYGSYQLSLMSYVSRTRTADPKTRKRPNNGLITNHR
jgi:hypothetical protein